MPSLAALTIRLACNQSSRDAAVDKVTGRKPVTWRGNSILIPCALFDGSPASGSFIDDISNILSATLVIRETNAAGTLLFTQTIDAADMDGGLAYSEWEANTGHHFRFSLDTTDSNFAAGTCYFAIAVATDDAGDITVATGNIEHREDGIGDPGAPDTPDYVSWSKAEADARYLRLSQELSELAIDPAATRNARGNLGLGYTHGSGDILNAPIFPQFASYITALTGGTAAALDALPTTALDATGGTNLILVVIGGAASLYQLVSGTDAEAAPGIIRPDDYHETTNAKVWRRVL